MTYNHAPGSAFRIGRPRHWAADGAAAGRNDGGLFATRSVLFQGRQRGIMDSDQDELLLTTPKFQVVRRRRQKPDGSEYRHAIVRHPGAVAIVAVLDDGRICLVKNFRPAVGRELIEVPAGTLEPGEDPAETARRELAEETGYVAGRMEPLHTFWMSPGILDEKMHVFVAGDLREDKPRREANEEIDNLVISWNEALRLIDTGAIRDAKTLAALLVYDRWRTHAPSR